MNYLDTVDLTDSAQDFEFTRKAEQKIRRVTTSAGFEDMDPDEIFFLLVKELKQTPFNLYLKRYLYERAEMTVPFAEVSDKAWFDTVSDAFEENGAPCSLEPTTTRRSAMIRSWLESESVRRSTVFALGFGLRMSDADVEEFLTKALREEGFRPDDPAEVVYRYCYRNALPYAKAAALLEQERRLPPAARGAGDPEKLDGEKALMKYLSGLRGRQEPAGPEKARAACAALYRRCAEQIAEIYRADEEEKPEKERREWAAEDVTPADLEKMLCSGIPLTPGGNLARANLSLLSRRFRAYRPTRQRMEGLLKGQLRVERYDLITLCFFLHSRKDVPGKERLGGFLDEANALLRECGMNGVYAADPYEAFVMICTLSDCPLAVFNDVWELSYAGGEDKDASGPA